MLAVDRLELSDIMAALTTYRGSWRTPQPGRDRVRRLGVQLMDQMAGPTGALAGPPPGTAGA